MAKYDVGILGLWSGCNYGSIMTYYALHQVVTSMGKSVLMIDKPILSENDVEHKETHSRRFGREHYEISKQYRLGELGELNSVCDTFLIGSDQVWNYGISKNFGKMFYFDFAGEENKKIAYAVSFGHGVDFAPPEERKVISSYMARMDGIAVRESDGVRLCREQYGINAVQVLDPVFLADPVIYRPLVEKATARQERPFLAAYILDPTPEKRAAILHLAKTLGGLEIINLLDGFPWKFQGNRKKMGLPNCIENLQVEDWLYYLSHAEFILTDSCHGVSFALVFKKNFIGIPNRGRGVSRFQSLSRLFHFEHKLAMDPAQVLSDARLLEPLDDRAVETAMEQQRRFSYAWLRERIEEKKRSMDELDRRNVFRPRAITDLLDTLLCTGCGACVNACPKDALRLAGDVWGYYRSVLDAARCIGCGQCIHVCPAHELPQKENRDSPGCYEFQAADESILEASSSGGIFSVLAAEAFRRGGIVVGAAWREDFTVGHILVDMPEELSKLRKSKYLQSYMGLVFREIKQHLANGCFVLFTGTPCQVAGLKKYLGHEYDNLLLVDLLCGNAPSAGFFSKYLQGSFPEGILGYEFRSKQQGWHSDCVEITLRDGNKIVRRGPREDDYQRVYHNHTMCPPHCEHCRYQAVPRFGDLTIGDFWGIEKRKRAFDFRKGASVILCNNKKGQNYLECLPRDDIGTMNEVPLEWLGGNGYAIRGSHNYKGPKRDLFYRAIQQMTFRKAVDYALKPNHGNYRAEDAHMSLVFASERAGFSFDPSLWEQHYIQGKLVLCVKQVQAPAGNHAVLPLGRVLARGKNHVLKVRFKVRTMSEVLNFHIKDSGSRMLQMICSYKIGATNDKWVSIEKEFVPNSDLYDEFSLGASQISGEGNYLMLDYIYIVQI